MNRIFFVLSELGCMWECRGLLGGGGWLGFVERADLSLRGWWGLLGFGGLVDAAKSHCFSVGESLFARSIDTSKEVWGIRPGAMIIFGFVFLGGSEAKTAAKAFIARVPRSVSGGEIIF
jgi:hypothetical protein